MKLISSAKNEAPQAGKVYCPICTHTVDALVTTNARHPFVVLGQKCPRCKGSLDAGYIMVPARAA